MADCALMLEGMLRRQAVLGRAGQAVAGLTPKGGARQGQASIRQVDRKGSEQNTRSASSRRCTATASAVSLACAAASRSDS